MSESYSGIPNEEVIPTVQSQIFEGHATARFAVGLLALGNEVFYPTEMAGCHRLRANVYALQAGFLSEDRIATDGGEYDIDDKRSVHFGILENCGDNQRVVATIRLITKEDEKPLPIERFFPEIFSNAPAPLQSVEMSRYITRHENRITQAKLKWPLFSRALSYGMANALDPAYAVVEHPLEVQLRRSGIPIQPLSSLKFIAEYNTDNEPIILNTKLLAHIIETKTPGSINSLMTTKRDFTYFGSIVHQISERQASKISA